MERVAYDLSDESTEECMTAAGDGLLVNWDVAVNEDDPGDTFDSDEDENNEDDDEDVVDTDPDDEDGEVAPASPPQWQPSAGRNKLRTLQNIQLPAMRPPLNSKAQSPAASGSHYPAQPPPVRPLRSPRDAAPISPGRALPAGSTAPDTATTPAAPARLIFRIWDTVDRGDGPKQVVKTFALDAGTSLQQLLRSAARKTDVAVDDIELVELATGLEVRAVVTDDQLPYKLLSAEAHPRKRYGFRKRGKVMAIEVQSGPVNSILQNSRPPAQSQDSASSSSSSSSASDKKTRKKNAEPVIGAPQGLQHITHVDREWTWTSQSGQSVGDQFVRDKELGRGAYGSVYKCHHQQSGFELAIKLVKANQSEEEKQEIMKEIDVLKKCSHANIVKYYGCFFDEEFLWILMDYCRMGSVLDLMTLTKRTLTEDQIAAVIRDSLMGLIYLHKLQIVHRDLKSANVLLTETGRAKLADFGVSAQLGGPNDDQNTPKGTPLFMAPEVLSGERASTKSDVWSLGITCIEMAESLPPRHKHPVPVAIYRICSEDPPTFQNPDSFSMVFTAFVQTLLQKDVNLRPNVVELMTHPFIVNAQPSEEVLYPLIAAGMQARGEEPPPKPKPRAAPRVSVKSPATLKAPRPVTKKEKQARRKSVQKPLAVSKGVVVEGSTPTQLHSAVKDLTKYVQEMVGHELRDLTKEVHGLNKQVVEMQSREITELKDQLRDTRKELSEARADVMKLQSLMQALQKENTTLQVQNREL
eukprot:CAMPEP_0174230264 /NCGR_PEP_ID=MMETSP0417-20130205/1057_1 /TAXON_ID=242541 /ORGANISM="Mayorella sp, Strain BSH-02190019" /LENGTH=751 /DNA_ID=CAMNT_0015307915 /DNA_START=114 /DNA_END=2366 /DNA_ORIENTATION=-